MLSPIVPYRLIKMHWTPEHAQPLNQWPEQHLDVSSTTSSPAHKSELYSSRGRSYSYAWANDDISALTASNLLKRYAEKYSGMLDSQYERPVVGAYPETGPFGGHNGQKGDLEPWSLSQSTDPVYPLVTPSGHDGIPGAKAVASSAALPGGTSVPVPDSSLSDPGYSTGNSCSGPPSHDFSTAYSSTYLSSGYCPQPGSALPPASLHALQPAPTLVPSYTSSNPPYNYPHQNGLAPSYTHPSASYIPSGLAAPTPLPTRPSVVGGSYPYQTHTVLGSEPGGSLKRKAFEMTPDNNDDEGVPYRKYSYDHPRPGDTSPYGVGDKGECRANGINAGNSDPQVFKSGKPPSQPSLEEVGKYSGLKPLISPPYGGTGEYSPPAGVTLDSGGGEHDFLPHHLPLKLQRPCEPSTDSLKGADQRLVELINNELQDPTPPLLWSELLGQTHVKAALEEDVLWPILRPAPARQPPRTILLFGPSGGGKATLSRSLASQLGAAYFMLRGTALASKWKAEAEELLHTLFQVAAARQPSVVYLSEVEALTDKGLQQRFLCQLETVRRSSGGLVIAMCATSRPDMLEEGMHHSFTKRYYVGLPDAVARRQVLLQALAPQGCCLNERELGVLLQRSEGFSVCEILQLCQHAAATASASSPGSLHGMPVPPAPLAFKDFENALCKVRPHATPKELDTCMDWSTASSH